MIDYSKYKLNPKEAIVSIAVFFPAIVVIAIIFYDSIYACIPGIFLFPFYLRIKKEEYKVRRLSDLRNQFCRMIESVSVAVVAGCSIENAFMECYKDMEKLYGADSYIAVELKELISEMTINRKIDIGLSDFATRSSISEIKDFAIVFSQAKRSGGNYKEIISKTVHIISQKIETEKEIQTILNGRVFEQKVMSIIPFFIIAYLRLSSGSYMRVLYHNPVGIIVMTSCLTIYFFALILSRKIIDIEV